MARLLVVELTEQQTAELQSLKGHFPFRIVYIAIAPDGTYETGAVTTMRQPNKLARAGYQVATLK